MLKKILLLILLISKLGSSAQNQEKLFEESYILLNSMTIDESNYSFKKAVFSVENAYMDGKLDTVFVNNQIKFFIGIDAIIMEIIICPYEIFITY